MLTIRPAQAWAGVKHVVTAGSWASTAGGESEGSACAGSRVQIAGYSDLRKLAPNSTMPRTATPAKTTADRCGRPPRNLREDESLRGGSNQPAFRCRQGERQRPSDLTGRLLRRRRRPRPGTKSRRKRCLWSMPFARAVPPETPRRAAGRCISGLNACVSGFLYE